MSEEEHIQEPGPSRKTIRWRFWLLQIVLIAILVTLVMPFVIKQKKKADQTRAISSLRQIGFALLEFESDFGSYPSEATAQLVTYKNPKHGHNLSGVSSNALFRQLFAAELTQPEQMFYAWIPDVRKPDGDISPDRLLEKGELGFAYVAGMTFEVNPARPIAFTPIIPGTTRFDSKPFDGFALVLRTDNSVRTYDIHKDGHIYDDKGISLLSPKNPIWDGEAPDIRYPEL